MAHIRLTLSLYFFFISFLSLIAQQTSVEKDFIAGAILFQIFVRKKNPIGFRSRYQY